MEKPKKEKKEKKSKKQEKDGSGNKSEIERLPKSILPRSGREPYSELRERAISCKDGIDRGRWDLSEILYRINREQIYLQWGYSSWEEYVQTEMEYTLRTAQYLTSIYEYFAITLSKDLSPEERQKVIDKIRDLGWTKARSLVDVATLKNLDKWIEKAKGMSSIELENATKSFLEKKSGNSEGAEKKYLLSFRIAESGKKTCEDALAIAQGVTGVDDRGWNFGMVCLDYVATHFAGTDDKARNMGKHLEQIGVMLGVNIIALDTETGKVVYGEKEIEKINKG